nr:hypothetical protein [Tanacetum cinerariifolium]
MYSAPPTALCCDRFADDIQHGSASNPQMASVVVLVAGVMVLVAGVVVVGGGFGGGAVYANDFYMIRAMMRFVCLYCFGKHCLSKLSSWRGDHVVAAMVVFVNASRIASFSLLIKGYEQTHRVPSNFIKTLVVSRAAYLEGDDDILLLSFFEPRLHTHVFWRGDHKFTVVASTSSVLCGSCNSRSERKKVDIVHPTPIASVSFPAATVVRTLAQHEEVVETWLHGIVKDEREACERIER